MDVCPPHPHVCHPFYIIVFKDMHPCVCIPSTPDLVLHVVQKSEIHHYKYACEPDTSCFPTPLHSCVEKCVSLCMSQPHLIWFHTLVRRCTCISTCIHVHLCVAPCEYPNYPTCGPTLCSEGRHPSLDVCMFTSLTRYWSYVHKKLT